MRPDRGRALGKGWSDQEGSKRETGICPYPGPVEPVWRCGSPLGRSWGVWGRSEVPFALEQGHPFCIQPRGARKVAWTPLLGGQSKPVAHLKESKFYIPYHFPGIPYQSKKNQKMWDVFLVCNLQLVFVFYILTNFVCFSMNFSEIWWTYLGFL